MTPARRGVSLGVSSSPENPTHVNIWLDNQTDKLQSYLMCCRSTFLEAIDLFDLAGNRLLTKGEQSMRKDCADSREFLGACTCSIIIAIQPHTMQVVDSGDLEDGYVLPPGRYLVAPSELKRGSCDSIKKIVGQTVKPELPKGIMVVIPDE